MSRNEHEQAGFDDGYDRAPNVRDKVKSAHGGNAQQSYDKGFAAGGAQRDKEDKRKAKRAGKVNWT